MVGQIARAQEISDRVALHPHALHRNKVQPVRADGVQDIAPKCQVAALRKDRPAQEQPDFTARQVKPAGVPHRQAKGGGQPVGPIRDHGAKIPVKQAVPDRDTRAFDHLKRATVGVVIIGETIIKGQVLQHQMLHGANVHRVKHRRIGRIGRAQKDRCLCRAAATAQQQRAIVPRREHDFCSGQGIGQGLAQFVNRRDGHRLRLCRAKARQRAQAQNRHTGGQAGQRQITDRQAENQGHHTHLGHVTAPFRPDRAGRAHQTKAYRTLY